MKKTGVAKIAELIRGVHGSPKDSSEEVGLKLEKQPKRLKRRHEDQKREGSVQHRSNAPRVNEFTPHAEVFSTDACI